MKPQKTQPKLQEFDVDAKYFEVTVPVREDYKAEMPKQMSVKFELDLDRANHDSLMKDSNKLPKKSNKGKHLVIFGDQSGSMGGKPFDVLKAGVLDIARHIFDDNGDVDEQPFDRVHMIFYASDIVREVSTN